jgi:hypothetical protein
MVRSTEDLILQTISRLCAVAACFTVTACTTAPAARGFLTTYESLSEQEGVLAKRRAYAEPGILKAQRAILISPVVFAPSVPTLTPDERSFITNSLSRAICDKVGAKVSISDAPGPETLRVAITITELRRTNAAAAATSILVLRAPIGLGALGVEAEALTAEGRQAASMIWRREADALLTSARASSIGDAYNFAGQFGEAFGKLLARHLEDRIEGRTDGEPCRQFGSTRLSTSLLQMFSPIQPPPSWEELPAEERPE